MSETLAFVDALGVTHDLDCGACLPDSVLGRFMPPVHVDETASIDDSGSFLNVARFEPREVTVPVVVTGTGEAGLRAAIRALAGAIDPTLGIGRLVATDDDAVSRELRCIYVGGFTGDETYVTQHGSSGAGVGQDEAYQLGLLIFRCFDPFWYDAADTVEVFTRG
jgi:hypothetical protein